MKKFLLIFLTLALLLSIGLCLPVGAENPPPQLLSGYYGIDRDAGLIGHVIPGTDEETVLSRLLPVGDLQLSKGAVTGSTLTLSQEGTVLDQLSLVVLSDCSGDGAFSVSDMLMVKSYLLNQKTFAVSQLQAADVSGDGLVTITDFLQMKSKVLGLMDFSPRPLAHTETGNAQILALGETCSFGPADGVLSSGPAVVAETTDSTEDSTTDPTEDSTTDPTGDSSGETTAPAAVVTIEGDAVTWEAGQVTAVRLGTARLTCQDESLIVTVCAEGLTVSMPQATLFVAPGAKTQLQSTTNHPAAPGAATYSVADPAVATVDSQGILTGVASGTTQVTATLPNGASASQQVRVIQLISNLTLDRDSMKVKPGSSKQLQTSAAPAGSPEKLIWTSSDPAIAKVDDKGLVTGVANGTATITCTTQYGKVASSCKVKVCNLIQVALTFDDGPSSQYTGKVLDLLKKYDVNATFFLVGNRISTSTTSVQRMAQEGHELGYHTWAHSYFSNMSAAAIESDLARFQSALKKACGKTATVYRAPGGGITNTALKTIPMPHIYWTIDTRDWATLNTVSVQNAIVGGLRDGAIILLHDIHRTTYEGTKAALDYIFANDMDVEFLTVTELLSRKGTPPKNGVTYYRG